MRFLLLPGSVWLILAWAVAHAQDDSSGKFQKLFSQYFEMCMKDWDAATHMTKEEWARTCRRVANARVKFLLEQDGERKPKPK